MKKLLILIVACAAVTAMAIQCYEVNVTNDLPTTAALATQYGFKQFTPRGANLKVYSQLVDVALNTPTSITNAALVAVTNANGYVFETYGKFATTTAQTYEDIFTPGGEVTLWLKTAIAASAGSTGTDTVQKVYLVIY